MSRNGRARTWRSLAAGAGLLAAGAPLLMGGCSEETERIFRDTAAGGLQSSASALADALISGAFAVFESGAAGAAEDAGVGGSTSGETTTQGP